MYEYRTRTCTDADLEKTLNGVEAPEEVFQILPTISFQMTKIVMGVSVPLPGQVQYVVVLRQPKK